MFRIQVWQKNRWLNAWRNIDGRGRAVQMQQELEYARGMVARVVAQS